MACVMCAQPLSGTRNPRRCAWPSPTHFFRDNWHCGTLDRLRELIDPWSSVSDHPRLRHIQQGDQQVIIVDLDDDHGNEISAELGLCLYVTWYKSRGQTDHVAVLDAGQCRPALEHDVLQAIRWLETTGS